MTDETEAVVEKTIAHTREQLESSEVDWVVARLGLQQIYDALVVDAPGHPALERLRDFIAKQDHIRRDH
jgi:hypothetical protein